MARRVAAKGGRRRPYLGLEGRSGISARTVSAPGGTPVECVEYAGNVEKLLDIMPDASVSLIVTSPPYNLGKAYEKRVSIDEYLKGQEDVIHKCVMKLKAGGSVCWQTGNFVENGQIIPLDIPLYPIFTAHGLKLRNRIVWHFGHGLHCKRRLSGRYETIMWFTRDEYSFDLDPIRVPAKYPNKRYFRGKRKGELSCNPLGKNPTDVWEIPNVKYKHCEKTSHPAQFPVELVERLILSMTKKGDYVFDPYMGSGSTGIAALKNNRNCIGAEKNKNYVKIWRKRISLLEQGELKTRPMGKPIHVPPT